MELVEGCQRAYKRVSMIAFIDDINIVVYGDSNVANYRALKRVHKVYEH